MICKVGLSIPLVASQLKRPSLDVPTINYSSGGASGFPSLCVGEGGRGDNSKRVSKNSHNFWVPEEERSSSGGGSFL